MYTLWRTCASDGGLRAFIEEVLAPTLRPGPVVVPDNLPAHEYLEVEQAIHATQCRLLFLPRYGP